MNLRVCSILTAVAAAGLYGRALAADPAEAAWRDLFRQPVPAAAGPQIDAVLAACGNDAARLRALIDADSAYEPFAAGWHRRVVKVVEGGKPADVEFHLCVPKGYSPARSYPFLLAAHWQDGDGRGIGRSLELLMGEAAERYLLLAPTLPDRQRGFVADPFQVRAHLVALDWARLNLNVDDDRIIVTGYGQGGSVAWNLAVSHPRLFAAAVPMAGFPLFRGAPFTATSYLENIERLPVWAIWGETDVGSPGNLAAADGCRIAAARLKELGNAGFRATELAGAGHYKCWPDGRDFVEFLSSPRRRAAPELFHHYFHSPDSARGYYVEAVKLGGTPVDFDQPVRVDLPDVKDKGKELSREEVLAAGKRFLDRRLYKIRAEFDRAKNCLTVRPLGITAIRVYVPEDLFDLGAPAEVRFERAAWKGRIPVSPRCMLVHYAASRDATLRVVNVIDLDASGPCIERYR